MICEYKISSCFCMIQYKIQETLFIVGLVHEIFDDEDEVFVSLSGYEK